MSLRWTQSLTVVLMSFSLTLIPSQVFASIDGERETPALGVGIQLLDVAADLQDDPRAQTYIIDNLAPGATIERNVRVSNNSSTAQAVSVYTSSATVDNGGFQISEGETSNELSEWTTPAQAEVALDAGETADIAVTISIPSDAAEGERYAAVLAEVRSAPDASTNVITANRAGIRMYVSVGPGNGPAAAFSIDSLTAARDDAGAPQVVAAVTNSGGRAVDIRGELSLGNGPSGLSAGPFDISDTTTLAPGESGEVSVTLDAALPNGPWDAALTLTSGLLSEEASASIMFPDAGTGDTIAVAEDGINWLIVGGGIVVALLALGIFVRMAILRRRAVPTSQDL